MEIDEDYLDKHNIDLMIHGSDNLMRFLAIDLLSLIGQMELVVLT